MTYKQWYNQKEEDIRVHPERHMHTFPELERCCFNDGSLDLKHMDLHSAFVDLGTNGGIRCDVIEGPCSCGAWHTFSLERKEELQKINKKKIVNRFELMDIE